VVNFFLEILFPFMKHRKEINVKSLILMVTLLFTLNSSANFSDVNAGNKVSSGLWNNIQKTIDGILNIEVIQRNNTYSAYAFSGNLGLSRQGGDFFDRCESISVGRFHCFFNTDYNLTSDPVCNTQVYGISGGSHSTYINIIGTSGIQMYTYSGGTVTDGVGVLIHCTLTSTDYKKPIRIRDILSPVLPFLAD